MALDEFKTNPEEIKNLLETCRLCLSEESIDCVIVEQNLRQQISDYLSIVISNEDGMSQNVCAICQLQITEFHQFRERCQEVQSTLQSIIHAENFVIKAELPSNNWNEANGSPLEEIDIHIKKESGNLHQENSKVIENNTQTITKDRLNKDTSTDGKYISVDVMFKIEDAIIKHEIEKTYEENLKIQDNDTHIENDSGNFHQEDTKTYKNNSQNMPIDNTLKEAVTDGQNIGMDDIFEAEDIIIIKHEVDIEEQSPLSSADELSKSTESQKIKCEKCDEVFTHRPQLYYHRRKNHRKKFICPTCKRPCLTRQHFERHIGTHQTDKQFKCDVCQQAFKWKGDVDVHKKRVHGPRMHKCSLCESSFATRTALTRHMHTSVHAGSVTKLVADRKGS